MGKYNEFTNQYSLSKTIRNALIPVNETQRWIEERGIIAHHPENEDKPLTGSDAVRAENYKYIKKLHDQMHRKFIEQCNALVLRVLDGPAEFDSSLIESVTSLHEQMELIAQDRNVDAHRSALIKALKCVFDYAAKDWVERASEDFPKIWQDNINELTEKIERSSNRQQRKNLEACRKKLQNKAKKAFKIKKSGVEALYSNTEAMLLLEWLIWCGEVSASGKELGLNDSDKPLTQNALIQVIRSFDNFHSYLSGFNTNRKNIYSFGEDTFPATSIAHRLFNQNFLFHVSNIDSWNRSLRFLRENSSKLKSDGFDFEQKLREVEERYRISIEKIFVPAKFIEFLSQTGIDRYNNIIGGEAAGAGVEKAQGINELLNLARLQLSATRSQIRPLQKLYKQILSVSDKVFIEEFESDKALCEGVKEFHDHYFNFQDKGRTFVDIFQAELTTNLTAAAVEADQIYIAKGKLDRISKNLTGSWSSVIDWVNANLDEQERQRVNRQSTFSVGFLHAQLSQPIDGHSFVDNIEESLDLAKAPDAANKPILALLKLQSQVLIARIEEQWQALDQLGFLDKGQIHHSREKDGLRSKQVSAIKTFLEACLDLRQLVGLFALPVKNRPQDAFAAWYKFVDEFTASFDVFDVYNKCRNYLSKKPFSTEKIKLNFNRPTLLGGWDRNKEAANLSVLFKKGQHFYLGIMSTESSAIFDYEVKQDDSDKAIAKKREIARNCLDSEEQPGGYQKINYKLLPGPNKMLPKVFFAKKNLDFYQPTAEVVNIKENKLYSKKAIEEHGIENLHKYIAYCIDSLCIHPEWAPAFGFSHDTFRRPQDYSSVDEFYTEVAHLGYKISFDHINTHYIDDKVASGELYLFEIYNKDFSRKKKSKGTDNLHTRYWKLLFDEQNLKDVVLKLNGEAEIFFRPASIKYSDKKMAEGHHAKEIAGKFGYPIIKDKRYTKDQYLFHCPITLNFKAPGVRGNFNDKINRFLRHNRDVNIIGIDRGERHLLYYSIINPQGDIIEQGDLDHIKNGFVPAGSNEEQSINYLDKLIEKEKSRDQARKNWTEIEKIKDLKAGYLSVVVEKLARLIIKYNAIVVLENLNQGFKRGRFKVERQVYQKFEKALIDKLNYLVFKECNDRSQPGHVLNAYQLANRFASFEKLGTQSGILFYTAPSYTSVTDPVTGFLKNVYRKYDGIPSAQQLWRNFDAIVFNRPQQRFEFTYNADALRTTAVHTKDVDISSGGKRVWTVCSCVTRSQYDAKNKRHNVVNVHDCLVELFDEHAIEYEHGEDLREQLARANSAGLHKALIYRFNQILNLRVHGSPESADNRDQDYILSPVEPFFDSRKIDNRDLPTNGDANGAYNIARKGVCVLERLNAWDGESRPKLSINKAAWENYCQDEAVVAHQMRKWRN